MPDPPAPAEIDLDKRTAQYVALRDKIASIKERHTAELKPYNETLFKLNNLLLAHLNTVNAQNVKTVSGTVYKNERASATIVDGRAFREFVVANEAWDLVDWKANKTEVKARVEAMEAALQKGLPPPNAGGLPPGINYTREYVAGVQRK